MVPKAEEIIDNQIWLKGLEHVGEARTGHVKGHFERAIEVGWEAFGCVTVRRKLRQRWKIEFHKLF